MGYLERLLAVSATPAAAEPSKGAKGGSDPFAGGPREQFHGLPPDCVAGLIRLADMSPPRLASPGVWPPIVADALRLQSEGWAVKALALGWEPMHLWGAHLYEPGLAVWLAGRRIVLLGERCCTVADSPKQRSVFNRRAVPGGSVWLWEYGRGSGE